MISGPQNGERSSWRTPNEVVGYTEEAIVQQRKCKTITKCVTIFGLSILAMGIITTLNLNNKNLEKINGSLITQLAIPIFFSLSALFGINAAYRN